MSRNAVLKRVASYTASSDYRVGVAVLDTKTGQVYDGPHAHNTFATESVIKVMIAARLLVSGRMHGSTSRRAFYMITHSDDAIASSLYGRVGGDGLLPWTKRHFHVPDLGSAPSDSGWWGNTHITPDGLVRLYAKLERNREVGRWLLNAMHHAARHGSDGTYQFFGLPSATKHAAVKQGWGCDYRAACDEADYNTTGYVNHDRYAVAVLARGPLRTYGAAIANLLTRVCRMLLPDGEFPLPPPTLASVAPRSGLRTGSTLVTLHGQNLGRTGAVYFGSHRATIVSRSPHLVRVKSPSHAPGGVTIHIETSSGKVGSSHLYQYFGPLSVTSVSPATGSAGGGSVVVVRGTGFQSVRTVRFGTAAGVHVQVLSGSRLTVTTPQHTPGQVDVRVETTHSTSPTVPTDVFTFA